MLEILAITGPIFLLIGTGFAAVRSGLLERAGIRPLGTFVVNFALPAMLFKTMAERRLDEALHWDMVIAYGLGSLLMVALTLAFTRFVQRRDLLTGAVFSMGTAMANSSFVGFPIALQLFGPQAGAALAAYAVVESVVMFPLLYVLGDAAASGRQPLPVLLRSIVERLVKNPFLLSLAAGAAWAASGVALPAPIGRAVGMLASTSAPVALFCIGGTLAGLSLKGMGGDLGLLVAGKLLVHPLAVFVAMQAFPVADPQMKTAVLLNAAMPMMSMYPILGLRYGREGICAAAVFAATLCSFFTISAALWLIGVGAG